MKKLLVTLKRAGKGQSFVELALVLVLLLTLLTGMVEFGNLLNQYINLVDGVREGARFGSNDDPFDTVLNPGDDFFTKIDYIIEGDSTQDNPGAIAPLILNSATDDVIISYVSVLSGGSIIRYPLSGPWRRYNHHTTQMSNSEIIAKLNTNAPNTGILVVEIFYAYHQILKLPFLTAFVGDPINVRTYAIMPLSAAEPTPTP